ncbi:MAG: murein biosynthesis integral membrane protein MurJ [Chloroflexi bacterium]|nr:murein biosynthesis integral membrane protein MurJ [Chloroflexota bacterium]
MTNSTTSPENKAGRALSGREIALATVIVMASFVLSGILGLVRQVVLASTFGADRELDAFYAAIRLPETLFVLVAGGALGSAFIPVFSTYLNKDDLKEAWRLASATLTFVALAASLSAIVGYIFAAPLVDYLLLPEANHTTQTLTVELMRIMLVTVVIFGISGLFMAILNSHQHFVGPALAPSMYNIGIILGALFLAPSMGIRGLAWGVVIGASLHLAVQVPVLFRLPNLHLQILANLRTPGVMEVLKLMGPRLIGLMVVQVNFWVNIALASAMVSGSISALQISFALMFTVLGILGQSVGTAVFPSLSALYAQKDETGFQRTFNNALANVLFLSIPAGFGMMILSVPIVRVLFERGKWTSADTAATAWALVFYAVGLMGHAALEILARTYYALHDTWTPVIVGGVAMLLNVVFSLLFVQLFESLGADTFSHGPYAGLALANSLATALESLTLWLWLRRKIPSLNPRPVLQTASRTGLAALGMVGAVFLWLSIGDGFAALLQLIGGLVIGGGSFFTLAFLLKVKEASNLPRMVLARIGKA